MGFLKYALRAAKTIQDNYFKQPRVKGFLGEKIVNNVLKGEGYLLYNLNINHEGKTQIDHILINQKGIIIIETKNYSGIIRGSEGNHIWLQMIGNKKIRFYSPIKQNQYHMDVIKKLINHNNIRIYSVIVFSMNSILNINTVTPVIKVDKLKEFISLLPNYAYSQNDLDKCVEILKPYAFIKEPM